MGHVHSRRNTIHALSFRKADYGFEGGEVVIQLDS